MLPPDHIINGRPVVGIDCETWLAIRGNATPPLVCTTLSGRGPARAWLETMLKGVPGVLSKPSGFLLDREASKAVWPVLVSGAVHLVGHRVTYDLGVSVKHAGHLVKVFDMLDAGAISDTLLREKLGAIAHGYIDWDAAAKIKDGHYTLASIVKKRFDVDLAPDKMKTPKGVHDATEWVEEKLACVCGLPPWYGHSKPPIDCPLPSEGGCEGYGLKGSWRLRYRQLTHVPVEDWPLRAVDYAIEDAQWAELACASQGDDAPPGDAPGPMIYPEGDYVDEQNQTAAAWAMALMAAWGPRCEEAAARQTLEEWSTRAAACLKVGREAGFVRADGTENRKLMTSMIAIAYEAKGAAIPRNSPTEKMVIKANEMIAEVDRYREGRLNGEPLEGWRPAKLTAAWKRAIKTENPFAAYIIEAAELMKGSIKYDRETLAESGDELLETYAKGTLYKSYMSKYAGILEIGITTPITSFPNPLVATGRSGWADPPLQQPPGKGGFREAFVPRPGYLYGAGDYDTIELCAQAQNLIDLDIGDSLAQRINSGIDPHTDLAAYRLGISYEEADARRKAGDPDLGGERPMAKAANFSYWGGAGAKSTVHTYGVKTFSPSGDWDEAIEKAKELKEAWKQRNPEEREYFAMVTELLDEGMDGYTAMQFKSGRLRFVDLYTVAANTYFQGRVADGAKLGIGRLARECYTGYTGKAMKRVLAGEEVPLSPLWGSRPWLLLHDELLAEVMHTRPGQAQAAVERMCVVLREAMEVLIPDVHVNIDPLLMRRWSKKADQVYTKDGVLLPWEPWKKGDDGRTYWSPWAGPRKLWAAVDDGSGRVTVYDENHNRMHRWILSDPVIARHRAECFVLGEERMA